MGSCGSSIGTKFTLPPVMIAREAIYTLFELGYIDEEHATAALLAVDAGVRRAPQRPAGSEVADPVGSPTPPRRTQMRQPHFYRRP